MVAAFAFGFSAFKNNQKLTVEQWHFENGKILSDANDPTAYEPLSAIPEPGCEGEKVLPCVIQFDNTNPATPNLAAYLATFPDEQAIVDAAMRTREN